MLSTTVLTDFQGKLAGKQPSAIRDSHIFLVLETQPALHKTLSLLILIKGFIFKRWSLLLYSNTGTSNSTLSEPNFLTTLSASKVKKIMTSLISCSITTPFESWSSETSLRHTETNSLKEAQ